MGLAGLIVVAATVAVALGKASPLARTAPAARASARAQGVLRLRAGTDALARFSVQRYVRAGKVDRARLRRLLTGALSGETTRTRGRARITYRYSVGSAIARVAAAGPDGGVVQLARQPVASSMPAPVLAQALRNNCESAALQILLATRGQRVDQLRLQAAFPRSGPLDPTGSGASREWGDPELGFVGRPDGGGVAGGFGVYPGPVQATAARFGAPLQDLSGRSPAAVYDELLAGHAVMAWVGLSDGPYGRWRSPQGKRINVNFGEHTVVLHGMRTDGGLLVSNPLHGTREVWTQNQFETMWQRLGRRALAA